MAEYKGIKGFKVQTVSTDPAASVIATGVWASGGDLNTARGSISGAGTQTAAVAFGGDIANPPGTPAPYTVQALTESYNGTSWTEVNDLNKARLASVGGVGTQTAALLSGGYTIPPSASPSPTIGIQVNVESWNGTSWTEVAEFSTSRYSFGTSVSSPNTDTMIAGGYTGNPPTALTNAVETWNGTSWASGTAMTTPKGGFSGLGASSTAVLMAGPTTELWNGSSWTEVAEKNNTRSSSASAGPSSSGLVYGGNTPPVSALTEYWDGSTWTEVADLGTARQGLAGAGSTSASSAALAAGGSIAPGARSLTTEEWTATPAPTFQKENLGQVYYNSTSNAFKVTQQGVPAGTWASITPTNTPRRGAMGAGTETDGMVIAGYPAPNVNVEIYNGSSWTEVANINNSRGYGGTATNSPTTSAIIFGGDNRNPALPGFSSNVETWNGTSWTETTDLPAGVGANRGAGTSSTAAISIGGASSPVYLTTVNNWNGSSWTSIASINTARGNMGSMGTETAALINAGFTTSPANAILKNTEVYNGSSWTEVGDTNSGRSGGGAAGISTLGLTFGGEGPTYPGNVAQSITEYWNGTSWTEVADLATAINGSAGLGNSGTKAISTDFANAEEFSPGTANFTLTAS